MFLVIKGDIGYHHRFGVDDISGIKTAAHTGFPDDEIALGFFEYHSGKNGNKLKIGKLLFSAKCGKFFCGFIKKLFIDASAVDSETFSYVN